MLQISGMQGALIVRVPVEVDISNAETVRAQLRDLCRTRLGPGSRADVVAVVVDLTEAPLLTMAAVAVLDEFRIAVQEAGAAVRLVVRGRSPRTVLRVLALDGLLPVFDSVDQALADGRRESGQARRSPKTERGKDFLSGG